MSLPFGWYDDVLTAEKTEVAKLVKEVMDAPTCKECNKRLTEI